MVIRRLRYILWAISLCIEMELHPGECDAEMSMDFINKNVHNEDCGCGYQYCRNPSGHPGKHANEFGMEWD